MTNREKASVHANRGWTCACGRTVFGNGGKSSHQRACRFHKAALLEAKKKALAKIEAGEWDRMSPTMRENFRHEYALTIKRLEAELAE